jgi:hypothetical protein
MTSGRWDQAGLVQKNAGPDSSNVRRGLTPGHSGESDHRRQRAGLLGNDAGQDEQSGLSRVVPYLTANSYERFAA